MAKILQDKEMADVIQRAVHDDEIDDADAYARFLEDLGELICTHFGGTRGAVGGPDFPGDELGWTCGFHVNECVPPDGGMFARYDADVVWRDGREASV